MEYWSLLIVMLGLTGYLFYCLLKGSANQITRTPVWLLWLVLMTPPVLWVTWMLLLSQDKSIPWSLWVGPFIICPLLYWWLIQRGRPKSELKDENSNLPKEDSSNSIAKEEQPKLHPITKSEETTLRNCFPWGIYYVQSIDYHPQAIICRGKLRTIPEKAYNTIKENVEQAFGDRFLVLFQESFRGQPFFALVPNVWAKNRDLSSSEVVARPGLAFWLMSLALLTTTIQGAIDIEKIPLEQIQSDPAMLIRGLSYSLALIGILGVHELSHYLTAIRYQIRATLPYFIPVPFFLGTFGAFIQMRSPVPNRRALFDVAIAGPIGGFILAVPILIWGLSMSAAVPIQKDSDLLNFDALDPRFSLLLSLFSKLALGSKLLPNMAIDLHPAAVAGYIGLVVTALNLIPVGQLDGGHIVHAMFGQRNATLIGQIARLLIIGLAIVQKDFLIWALILLLMPVADRPALNDVTELDNWRDLCGLLSLVLLVSILLPLPGALAQWLSL